LIKILIDMLKEYEDTNKESVNRRRDNTM